MNQTNWLLYKIKNLFVLYTKQLISHIHTLAQTPRDKPCTHSHCYILTAQAQ